MAGLAARWAQEGRAVGFVPTMGALHSGHASLIRRARDENERLVVSLFVNPLQFGPGEDFSLYPRTFPADRRLCAQSRVDVLYRPSVEQVYPPGFKTEVEVPELSGLLCGRFRPGHFKGVATVVLKLLETTRPSRAYFGEKDFQQLVIIKKMVKDLNVAVSIIGCPTIRDGDGLALSSRNRYLSAWQRSYAPMLYAALLRASKAARLGGSPGPLIGKIRREILKMPEVSIDYVEIVNSETLGKAPVLRGSLRLLAAVRVARTRLIDNIALSC